MPTLKVQFLANKNHPTERVAKNHLSELPTLIGGRTLHAEEEGAAKE